MKKLTNSVLAVVLSSAFVMVSAQKTKQDTAKTKEIEGVVVTALGIKREEKSLPYATQMVKAKDLNVVQNVDVKSAIAGKVAGVQINGQAGSKLGQTGKLRLRGAVSMLSDEDPIYVLDGVIVDPNTIDMDNVESVNVLKGPNATALYGQRAQYGVVVLTLKKGSRSRLSIELNTTTNVDVVARTMKYQNIYGQGYSGEGSMGIFKFDPAIHLPEWSVFDGKYYKTDETSSADESWGAKMDGREYVPWYAFWKGAGGDFGKTTKYVPQANNIKDFYDKAMTYKNTISVSGGSDNYTARLSFTNLQQNGITPNTNLKRNYLNFNGNYKFDERLSVETVLNFSQGRTYGEFDDGYSNPTSGSFNQWFARDLDMKKMRAYKDLENSAGYHASWNWFGADSYTGGGINDRPAFWYNPFTYMDRYKDYTDRRTLTISVAPTYKISNAFSVRLGYSRVDNTSNRKYFMPYSLSKSSTGTIGGYTDYLNGFGYTDSNYTEDQYDARILFKKKFGDFDVNAMAGGNITKMLWSSTSAQMDVFGKLQWLINPDVYNFRNANIAPVPTLNYYQKDYKSLYGNASIGYKDTYFVDFSLRNDINSAYLNTNNSFFTYSLGGSIVLSNLWEKNDILSYLKIRGGIAQIASDITARQINPQYRFNDQLLKLSKGNYLLALEPTMYVDPGLKPAINENIEGGVDLKFLNNRLSLSATYYNEKRNNEPLPVTLPSSTGKTSIFLNSGSAKREGIEANLSGDIFRNPEGFSWTVSLNFAKNKSTITRVAEGLSTINYGFAPAFGYVSLLQIEGQEWGQLYGTGFKYDANGNRVVNENTGLYEFETNKSFGSVLPDFTGGIYNSFSYKGFTLAASIDFQKGGKFFSLSEQWGNSSGLLFETAATNDKGFNVRDDVSKGGGVHVKGVTSSGKAVDMYVGAHDYFTQFHGNRIAEPYIRSASYVKLREVALSYELPKSLFSNTRGIKGMSIGLVGRNLWLIAVAKDNVHRQDPSEMSQAYGEDGQLPSTRGFGVNVKINF
ncbi:SusC/RagA family TonB-linked outer membrane protein [Elizabethkingia anophelis]|uniref:SusC/RagA family TonB-linked outer membrane protein n=1 Tax=Elizabethkingia anophelis TaxID=1117645 RepID=UPI001626C6E7|nr:SusC/RagA family TonB-linked outer membrane protein [Elizabethkingia anophelis]